MSKSVKKPVPGLYLARTLALDITDLIRNDLTRNDKWLIDDGEGQFSVKFVDEYGQAILVATKFDPAGNPEEIRRFKITVAECEPI